VAEPECTECQVWRELARRDAPRAVVCGCGVAWRCEPQPVPVQRTVTRRPVAPPARRPVPAKPPAPIVPVSTWRWTPSAPKDMAALAWTPGAGEPPSWLDALNEDELGRELREDRRTSRRVCARRRLDEMCRHGRDGARLAAVVWYVYGCRGEILREREASAALVTDRFASKEERVAFREKLARTGGVSHQLIAAATVVGLGNALIGAATRAYELDEWEAPVDLSVYKPPTAPRKKSTHQQFVERMVRSFAESDVAIEELTAKYVEQPAQDALRALAHEAGQNTVAESALSDEKETRT
jgi:hypothetical protein